MSGYLSGLFAGLGVGIAIISGLLVRERRRTRELLFRLLEGGPFRLYTVDGQPAPVANLVAAMDQALHLPTSQQAKRKRSIAIFAFLVFAFVGFYLGFLF